MSREPSFRRGDMGFKCAVCESATAHGLMPDGRLACTSCARTKKVKLRPYKPLGTIKRDPSR